MLRVMSIHVSNFTPQVKEIRNQSQILGNRFHVTLRIVTPVGMQKHHNMSSIQSA